MKEMTLNASSRIMYEEAQKRDISITDFGDDDTLLMKKNGLQWYTRGSRTSLQSSIGRTIANNKILTKKILNFFNLPTAKGITVSEQKELKRLNSLSFPLVMKPIAGAHGRDVIVGIKNIDQANELFNNYGKKMLFEEMLVGIEYRVVCVDFVFVAAAFRKPAFVVGDGVHTIKELVDEKNKHPWREEGHRGNLSFIKVDEIVIEYLKEQGLTLDSIPEKMKEVFLRKTSNLSTGGEAWDVTSTVCKENKILFQEISKACDLNTVGIDIMCQSLEKPIIEQKNAGVIEVNGSPGLRMHHYPLKGNPINVAAKILDMVENKL